MPDKNVIEQLFLVRECYQERPVHRCQSEYTDVNFWTVASVAEATICTDEHDAIRLFGQVQREQQRTLAKMREELDAVENNRTHFHGASKLAKAACLRNDIVAVEQYSFEVVPFKRDAGYAPSEEKVAHAMSTVRRVRRAYL